MALKHKTKVSDMKKSITWQGIADQTLEKFSCEVLENSFDVYSEIRGRADGIAVILNYHISINRQWEVYYASLNLNLDNEPYAQILTKGVDRQWQLNGKPAPEFDKCVDIDITLTPFTNSLPINRLNMELHEKNLIDVIYFDIIEKTVKPAKQVYEKLSNRTYKFQTVPNDFEAIIAVDEDGFVTSYPGLFSRTD